MRRSNNLTDKIPLDIYWRVRDQYKENSGLQFFRKNIGIQSGPDASEESRLVMILTNLVLTGILCSLLRRLILERNAGKKLPEPLRLEFLKKFSENKIALSDAKNSTSRRLYRGGIADLSLLITLLAICQVMWDMFLGNNRLFCFIDIRKFSSFKNFALGAEDLVCWN